MASPPPEEARTFTVSCVVCGESTESSGRTREEAWQNLVEGFPGPGEWKYYRRGEWLEMFCPRHDIKTEEAP